jgi:hypothetical protein
MTVSQAEAILEKLQSKPIYELHSVAERLLFEKRYSMLAIVVEVLEMRTKKV